jgi:hypothetical protein
VDHGPGANRHLLIPIAWRVIGLRQCAPVAFTGRLHAS